VQGAGNERNNLNYIKEFKHDGETIAILVKKGFRNKEPAKHATFISSDDCSLQLGIGYYPKGLRAPAHTHERATQKSQYEELLHLVRGRMKVDLYTQKRVKFTSFIMEAGETVHLISGGHGFTMITPCKCIEVKQGPYTGRNNKAVFEYDYLSPAYWFPDYLGIPLKEEASKVGPL
jgi:hypothetical protein